MDNDGSIPSCDTGGRIVALAVAFFAILSLAAALTSPGFLDADAATHYLFARYAFHWPFYLVNTWGRPLATGLYAVGAALDGRFGVRMVSLTCAIGCALIAWRLAIAQRFRRPALAAIFTLGQPLLFLHSFSEMTELPFAFFTGLAFLAYRNRYWGALALAASLLPMGRPEGFGFCLLAAIALIVHRRWFWLPLLAAPTLIWDYAGWTIEGHHGVWWQWLIHSWPYSSGSDYGRGPLLHFVLILPMLVSPAALPAVWIGIARSLQRRPRSADPDTAHLSRCRQLIALIPLTVLIVHSLLHWLGRLSSNGELRYLLIAAPFWGLLAASGWEWAFDRLHWHRPVAWAALALLAPALLDLVIPIVPAPLSPQWKAAQQLVAWYTNSPLRREYPRLLFAHPAVDYFLNCPADDPVRSTAWSRQSVAQCPPGTLLIWDADLAVHNADPARDVTVQQVLSTGWKETFVSGLAPPGWRLFLSQPRQ